MPEAPPCGIDEAISIRIGFRLRSMNVGSPRSSISSATVRRIACEHQDGAVEPGELPQPGIRPLRREDRADERISGDDQVRERAELDDPILVSGRFGVAISIALGLILGRGPALPGMTSAAGIDEPGMADILRDIEVGEGSI